MASGRDKSWAEIAGDAFELAKQAGGKVVEGIREVGSKLLPQAQESREEEPRIQEMNRRARRDPYGYPPAGLDRSGGLFGRAAGGLLGGMMDQVMSQMAQGAQDSEEVLQESISRIQNDARVASALGGSVQILPGMRSQSSSTVIFNGQRVQETTVGFRVVGSSGLPAAAQASVKDGQVDVTVRLPDGRVVKVMEDGGGSGGGVKRPTEVIDVEWREVK
jgi:hypothetical protein